MANPSELNVAVIICSQRAIRVGPSVTEFVYGILQSHFCTESDAITPTVNLTLLDLAKWKLPLYDESGVPSQIRNPADYEHQHTRDWSAEISKYNAFVFVTPQYNWGYPASVKNAIDYLFHEWAGKKALVVSYGGRGGGRAGAQLKQVLMGVRMKVCEKSPELAFTSDEVQKAAALKGKLIADWTDHTKTITDAFEELLAI